MKDFLELNKENLYQKYIVDNVRLKDMPLYFDATEGRIRGLLVKFNITKTPKQISENSKNTFIERYGPEAFKNKLKNNSTPENKKKAIVNSVKARKENRIKRLANEGITFETVYNKYIIENKSITKTGEYFNRNKNQMRKLLDFFDIQKSKEMIEASQKKGFNEFYSDPIKVSKAVNKTQETIKQKYGNNWYYHNPSKIEIEIFNFVKDLLPGNIQVINGDYSTISRPVTGGALQLDIYIPSLKFAIEVNGEYWHDRTEYEKDLKNKTINSREALKDHLCAEKQITLFHIWVKDWKNNKEKIKNEIQSILNTRI